MSAVVDSFGNLKTPARLGCANHAASRSSVCHRGQIATKLRLKRTVPEFIGVSKTRVYKDLGVFSEDMTFTIPRRAPSVLQG
jgi:hypothetical protein